MARTPIDHDAARDLGKRIAQARKALEAERGRIPLDREAAEIYATTGVYVPRSTVYNYWNSKVDPNSVALESALAIARYLRIEPEDLGPVIAERVAMLRGLLDGGALVGAGDGNRTRVLSLGS